MSRQRVGSVRAAAVAITVASWAAVLTGGVFDGPTRSPALNPQKPAGAAEVAPKRTKAPQAERWRVSRTPWGDPDLQGSFANGDEYATPLERPDTFAGRRLEDIKGQELADVRRAELQQVIDLLPGGRVRGPDGWWVQNLTLGKGGQAWLVVDPPDGKIPALTPEARLRAQAAGRVRSSFLGGPFDGPEDLGLLDRCITRGVPGSMIPVMYGNNYQIVQVPGYVVITYEIIHETRIITVDGRPHLGRNIRQHMGDARGHWDGDSLVVETTNFTAAAAYRGANPTTLRVIERFTRVSADRIDWTATIDDPSTWTRPWTFGMPLTSDPHGVFAFECHEGNYGLRNILSAARAEDGRGRAGEIKGK
jgi:hypothetical protein